MFDVVEEGYGKQILEHYGGIKKIGMCLKRNGNNKFLVGTIAGVSAKKSKNENSVL